MHIYAYILYIYLYLVREDLRNPSHGSYVFWDIFAQTVDILGYILDSVKKKCFLKGSPIISDPTCFRGKVELWAPLLLWLWDLKFFRNIDEENWEWWLLVENIGGCFGFIGVEIKENILPGPKCWNIRYGRKTLKGIITYYNQSVH